MTGGLGYDRYDRLSPDAERSERLAFEAHCREMARDGGRGTLAIDFDDTLTAPGGVEAVVELRRRGYGLVVFTANADRPGIRSWLAVRWPPDAGPIQFVTDRKPQSMRFIDDKAFVFTDWTQTLAEFP